MCGIFGVISSPDSGIAPADFSRFFIALGTASQTRGREGSGVLAVLDGQTWVHRSPDAFARMTSAGVFRSTIDRLTRSPKALREGAVMIGHARLATNGSQGIESNNQPVAYQSVYCLHNGIVVNATALWRSLSPRHPHTEVDSEVISALVADGLDAGRDFSGAVAEALPRLEGEFSIAVADSATGEVALSTNNGSLYFASDSRRRLVMFASEKFIIRKILRKYASLLDPSCEIVQVRVGSFVVIRREMPMVGEVLPYGGCENSSVRSNAERRATLRLHDTMMEAERRRRALRRCARCVLPETMPFIRFDQDGVCNYCRGYSKKPLLGEAKLEETLARFRSPDGAPDCLIAFSGGRDSSYALHLLKRRYGMHPIAYTYDWGMVTDLARRNQARMCGRLGIEHIWISADISAKRRNIRANVEAWMAKPDIGMVPLFMAGDKQFFYHGHRTMKKTGIRLMVFATNHFERTDFKVGFCGIAPARDQNRPNYLSLGRKLALVRYYLWQYLRNPRYFNRSVIDTIGAFLSYYALDNEATFLHLFDYVPWDEREINETLIDEYDWETAPDSTSTWRIGDGTAAFYNYVYRTACGFSEQDTFRSNQVREGVITREQALALVDEEAAPRFDSIQEYCSLIGVPFSALLSSIYRLPRLY